MKIKLKSSLPHLVSVIIFLVITWAYFHPLLKGKEIRQGDMINSAGMSKEIQDYRKSHSDEPLWTNSMFGGMPAYQIAINYPSNLIKPITNFFIKIATSSGSIIFICFLGFYMLLIVLGVNSYLSIIGALAFGFSSYLFIIIEAGHVTKGFAIAYMAPVIAGILLTYKGKYLLGAGLTSLALALEISANHLQITYYLSLIILILIIIEFKSAIKRGELRRFFTASTFLFLAAALAVGPNITNLWATYEYGNYTTRGKSELSDDRNNKTNELDKDYATQWSYGISESFTLMVPDFMGGESGAIKNNNKNSLKKADSQYRQYIGEMDSYWGEQPFTSGPVYAGAFICFLFVLGLFIVDNSLKWWLLSATLLSLTLSWGKNMFWLTEWFLDYVPGYNKFRTVSMILVIAEFAIPLLAVLTLKTIADNPAIIKIKRKAFYLSLAFTAGLCLLLLIMPEMSSSFFKTGEYNDIVNTLKQNNLGDNQVAVFMDGIASARKSIFQSDLLRSLIIILIGASLTYLYGLKKFKPNIFYASIGILIISDMWNVDKRYLNDESYVPKKAMERPFQPSVADNYILQDHFPGYRVLNLSVSTFNDASTSYFNKSIGGYHGAKLKRYQELIDYQINGNIRNIVNSLNTLPSITAVDSMLANQSTLNMLNTKYIIYNSNGAPLVNRNAFGPAWYVKNYLIVDNADDEIKAVGETNLREIAIIDKRFAGRKWISILSCCQLVWYHIGNPGMEDWPEIHRAG